MRKIVFGFCALTVATWLLNLGFNPPAMNGRGLTHEVFFLNGVLAWSLMAMAIVIAARPAWLEKVTATPLDELYKWHRTLGIWAAVLTLFHFFTKELMRPVLSLVTLEPVPKIVRGELTGFDAFWSWMQDAAKTAHGKIRLVWCIKSKESEPMFANVEKMAERAGIHLEVFESAKKRLNAESLFAGAVSDTVALCAGEGLASAVSRAYVEAGGNADKVRKEHFNWR